MSSSPNPSEALKTSALPTSAASTPDLPGHAGAVRGRTITVPVRHHPNTSANKMKSARPLKTYPATDLKLNDAPFGGTAGAEIAPGALQTSM